QSVCFRVHGINPRAYQCGGANESPYLEQEKVVGVSAAMITNPKETAEVLLAQGKLTAEQFDQVRRRQKRLDVPQHRAVVDLNFASEEDTWRALAQVSGLEFVDIASLDLSRETLQLIPIKLIFHYRMLPIGGNADSVTLAFSEPPRPMELGNLRLLLNKRFDIQLATPSAIRGCIKKHFGLGAETIQKL